MKLTATSVAWIFAASCYAAAAVGFLPNPLLGPHGLFVADTAHNMVHLLTGVGFTVVALAGSKASVVFMQFANDSARVFQAAGRLTANT
jgi:hypothetical protein